MASAGYSCVVKYTGTAVAMSAEATTLSGGNTVAQITDATKRIIDPATAITVNDDASDLFDVDVVINYLFGKVTRTDSGAFTGPVVITGAYLPTYTFAEAHSFELNFARDLLDSTVFDASSRIVLRTPGLKDCSGSIGSFDNLQTDLDSGGTTIVPWTDFQAGTRRVIEITFPSAQIFRAFVRFSGVTENSSAEDLLQATLEFQATSAIGTDQTEGSAFGFSTD